MAFDYTKFAQYTPGEVSTDQAIRNYFYMAPDEFNTDIAGPNYFGQVADELDIGSEIHCLCKVYEQIPPEAGFRESTVVFQVQRIQDTLVNQKVVKVVYLCLGPGGGVICNDQIGPPHEKFSFVPVNCIFRGLWTFSVQTGVLASDPQVYSMTGQPEYLRFTARTMMIPNLQTKLNEPGVPLQNAYWINAIKPVPINNQPSTQVRVWWGGPKYSPATGTVMRVWIDAYELQIYKPGE